MPLNIAHRGASGHAVENTLAAFRLARELGADGIELDVQLTSDGEPVVYHDYDLKRLFGIEKAVNTQSLSFLKSMNFGVFSGAEYADERIPTLSEALEAAGDMIVNIELKGEGWPAGGLPEAVVGTIREFSAWDRVVVSSFNPFLLRATAKLDRSVSTAYLFDPDGRRFFRGPLWGYVLGTQFLNPARKAVTANKVRDWHDRGYRVMTWTVNDRDEMRRMIGFGVDAIITNYPDRLAELLLQEPAP